MLRECSYRGCASRRVHHERPDTPRGTQYIEVKEYIPQPVYCSYECALMDGFISLRYSGPQEYTELDSDGIPRKSSK